CNHTSFPGSSHRVGRVENDMRFFFEEVARPDLPFQRSAWGLADRILPEVKLSEAAGPTATSQRAQPTIHDTRNLLPTRLAVVADVIGPGQSGLYDTTPLFNRASYPTS